MPSSLLNPGMTPPPAAGALDGTYEVLNDYVFFDTEPITNAQQAVNNFFVLANAPGDQTITNMPAQGQLPDGWVFDVQRVYATFLVLPFAIAAAGVTGAAGDLANVLNTCRATVEFTYNSKSYGVRPLRSLPPDGQVQAFSEATNAATNGREVAWVAPVGGIAPYLAGLRIQPKTQFKLAVTLAVAPTITTSPLNLYIGLCGRLYRKVT